MLEHMYADLLDALAGDRRVHSLAVGAKAAEAADLVPASLRADLVSAATLHDIGYGHVDSGFHPLDGARYLASIGFPRAVCNLVINHSASSIEADERGLDRSVFDEFAVDVDLGATHAVLWWADMTTGPRGEDVTVEERLDEICERYGPDDLVTRFIDRARDVLLRVGQSPVGSIQVPV